MRATRFPAPRRASHYNRSPVERAKQGNPQTPYHLLVTINTDMTSYGIKD